MKRKSDFILEGPDSEEMSRDESTLSKPVLTPISFTQ